MIHDYIAFAGRHLLVSREGEPRHVPSHLITRTAKSICIQITKLSGLVYGNELVCWLFDQNLVSRTILISPYFALCSAVVAVVTSPRAEQRVP